VTGNAGAADRPACVGQLADWAAARYGDAPALRYRRDGRWRERSYLELATQVHQTAAGLRALGLGPGDRIGLLAETRPEWTAFDLAIASLSAVCVPVHPSTPPAECARLLGLTGARAVVCADDGQRAKIASVRGQLPALRHVVVIEGENPAAITLTALRARSPRADAERDRLAAARCADPGQVATIVHTSGTTGPPKPCPLTHRNWRAALDAVAQSSTMGRGDVTYLYLPLAYVFARIMQLATLEAGATLAYYHGAGRSSVMAELAEVRPTRLPSVPRLFEKVYAAVTADLPAALVAAAVRLGTRVRSRQARGEPVEPGVLTAFECAERRLFAPVRAVFGGRVEAALSSAAPIAAEVLEFFHACGVPVYEAYGLTESAALVSANLPGAARLGTVGRPMPGVEVRIGDRGEVLVRGECVFDGYPDRAESGVSDGWLRTGDFGTLDADGYLRITGRAREVIVTAAGANLAPAFLENHLRRSRWISHAVMHGDRRPYPVALITLDAGQVLRWARERGLPGSVPALARHPAVVRAVQRAVDRANRDLSPPHRIGRFAILDHDFSITAGELTPTLKPRRTVIADRYADVLDRLYVGGRRGG
jgi:long-chain acyl-CoA synthetase